MFEASFSRKTSLKICHVCMNFSNFRLHMTEYEFIKYNKFVYFKKIRMLKD